MGFKKKRQQKKEIKKRIYRPHDQREKEALLRQRWQSLFTFLFILLVVVGVVFVILWGRAKDRRAQQEQTESTEGISERGFTVVLDPGHGFDDAGVALAEDLAECDYNLMVVNEVKRILEEAGLRVHITREQDGIKKALSDEDRLTYAAAMAADAFVSVHACEETGVYYSLLSDATGDAAHLAGCLGNTALPESEYDITKGRGFPAVRMNVAATTPYVEAARLIAQGIIQYKDEYYRVKTMEEGI
ncbi:MAG: N-acetylmuramoyl-L-alanine amidase [Clostridiales bacterium]|nr:N-acetylmuramoyl-L-alanine amidase [Clostridiales bacterium]